MKYEEFKKITNKVEKEGFVFKDFVQLSSLIHPYLSESEVMSTSYQNGLFEKINDLLGYQDEYDGLFPLSTTTNMSNDNHDIFVTDTLYLDLRENKVLLSRQKDGEKEVYINETKYDDFPKIYLLIQKWINVMKNSHVRINEYFDYMIYLSKKHYLQ